MEKQIQRETVRKYFINFLLRVNVPGCTFNNTGMPEGENVAFGFQGFLTFSV